MEGKVSLGLALGLQHPWLCSVPHPHAPVCRVKEHCIQRGFSWNDSLASTSCAEAEYYEDLLRFYRYNYRVRGGLCAAGCPVLSFGSYSRPITRWPLPPTRADVLAGIH